MNILNTTMVKKILSQNKKINHRNEQHKYITEAVLGCGVKHKSVFTFTFVAAV